MMHFMTWVPFGADAETHATLVDGTPDWMLNSLQERFDDEFRQAPDYAGGYRAPRVERMRRFELEARMRPLAQVMESKNSSAVWRLLTETERLRAFDWIIRDNVANQESGNEKLERVLREGGGRSGRSECAEAPQGSKSASLGASRTPPKERWQARATPDGCYLKRGTQLTG